MVVPAQSGVSASGGFTYSIPIAVPPGTAGMVPSLSIDYSSGSGAGTLGLGWSLDGLPSISRCARTNAEDGVHGSINYDANDRFCLNGQRLIAISGTYGADSAEYRTEINNYTKIISYGTSGTGPTYFKVWTRAGKIMEFGNTTDSRVQPAGTTVRTWALNKLSDPLGNYLTVTYNSATGTDRTSNGEIYPTRIDYTGNAGASLSTYNSVQFSYTARNAAAIVPAYQAGYVQKTNVLLSDVKTYAGSTLVTDYKLAYTLATNGAQNDELTSVTQCDGSVTPICLPPLTFTWQGSRDTLSYSTTTTNIAFLGGSTANSVIAADMNGDGLTDAVVSGCTTQANVFLNTPSGISGTAASGFGCTPSPAFADINGDGLDDLIGTSGSTQTLYLNSGSALTSVATLSGARFPKTLSDFDGDGRLDYARGATGEVFHGNGNGTFTDSGTAVTPTFDLMGDFNGDGCEDLLTIDFNTSGNTHIDLTCASGVKTITSGASYFNYTPADFNGDGLDDLLTSNLGTLLFSTGNGFSSSSITGLGTGSVVTGDWNGDGKKDVAVSTYSGGSYSTVVYLSTGTAFVSEFSISGETNPPDPGDWNSDGADDLWVHTGGTTDTLYLFNYVPEYVQSINNGLGAVTTVTYDRLNKNGSLYTKGTGATYPTQDQDGPTYVVASVSSSNGIGGSHTINYSYAGKKTDISGYGSLGFTQTSSTDAQTGLVETTNYRTDFPYAGEVSSQTVTSGAVTLSSVTNTFSATTLTGISSTHYYNVLLSQSVVARNDLDGTALPGVTTAYTYDSYANPLTITKTVTDGSSSAVTNTYNNDTTHWILGELTSSSTTNTVPDPGANVAPIAAPDSITTNTNTAITFDPRANDIDADGDALTISSAANGSHGTSLVNSGTSVTYTPSSGYAGTDSFTYVISDGHSHTATGTVTVTVGNQPPVAVNDNVSTSENTATTFDPRTNDSDPEGDTLTITAKTNGSHGTVTINSGTSLTYTPATGYAGSDSFTYTISDGHSTSTATVNVTVNNRAPTAVNDAVSTGENAAKTFDPRTNDSDPDGDTLTITGVSVPSHGTASVSAGTSVIYTPATGYTGSDSFTYTISDGHGHTASATVTMTVSNLAPTAVADSLHVTMNVAKTFDPRTNDTDPEGDTLTITGATNGSHGTVTYTGTSVTYTPATSYTGSDSFTYTISDGHGNTATGTVSVTVATNQAPVANDDSATTPYDGRTVSIYALTNDSDIDGDTLTITATSTPTSGSVVINSGTSLTFTGPATWKFSAGLTSHFTYTISDGHSHTATATVYVTSSGASCTGSSC